MTDSAATIKRERAGRVRCTLTFTEQQRAAAEEKALERLGASMQMPGFRAGKAPISAIRERVKPEQLFEETVHGLIGDTLPGLVQKENLKPIVAPRVDLTSRDPLTIVVTIVERPEVTVKGIDKIAIEKKEVKADPKDIERVIQSVLKDERTTKEVDRASRAGDQMTIDFTAHDLAGNAVAGLQGQGYSLVIGDAHLLPGFEEQLVGLKKGEEKTFSITMPPTHPAKELQGKTVSFKVKVLRVEEVTLPELTDEFVKTKLNMKSAADFRATVEKSVTAQEQQFESMRRERLLLEEIKKRTTVELAPELVDEELRGLVQEWEEQLKSRNQTVEQWLQQENKKLEDLQKDLRQRAEDRLRLRMGITKIIEEKKIDVTAEDMARYIGDEIQRYPEEQHAKAREAFVPGGELYIELKWRRTVDKAMEMLLAQ